MRSVLLCFLLFLVNVFSFAQKTRYEAQLSFCQMEISPEVIFAFMPDFESSEAQEIIAKYDRPENLLAFENYNIYEAYLHNYIYTSVQQAFKERFGVTISSMVNKVNKTDSTVYGFPLMSKKSFKDNSGYYFVKLQVKVSSLENANMAAGQPADQSTMTPVIQMSMVLYDKEGKKVKKAAGKYQSLHFVEGTLQSFTLWDGRSRLSGFKVNDKIRESFLREFIQRGIGKLQESYYK